MGGVFTLFLSCSIRAGGSSAEVDNYHSGGVGYPIDIDTGVISGYGTNIAGDKFLFHPSTNAKVIGFEIPNWEELKNYIATLNQKIPDARMIAWDIAVLEDGFEIVEANFGGDHGFMQAPIKKGLKRTIINNY